MATKTIVVDDISGQEIPEGEARTLVVGMEGQWYQLDLHVETHDRVRAYLAEVVENGTKVDKPPTPKPPKKERDYDVPTVRKWAQENGYTVGKRSPIPEDVVAAWRAAQQSTPDRIQAARAASSPPETGTSVPGNGADGAGELEAPADADEDSDTRAAVLA